MAAPPSVEDIEQMVLMSGIPRDEAIRRLKGNNNDLNLALNELFDDPGSLRYKWEEGAFSGDRDGAPDNNSGISFRVHGPDDPGGGSFFGAPTRPPSRSSNTSPLGGVISLAAEHAAADPRSVLSHDEIGDIDLQRALAQSAEEAGMPAQQYGITQGTQSVQFGPANRPTYDENQWGMVLGNSPVQEIFPDPDAVDRRREDNMPAFLKPSVEGDRLAAILTIYHEIPLMREIFLNRKNLIPDYGNDPEWWTGKAIKQPIEALPGSSNTDWGLPNPQDYDEFIQEIQRLMAFLDKTDRSYGSAKTLANNAVLKQIDAPDVEHQFFESWKQIYAKANENVAISSLFTQAVQPSSETSPLQSREFAMLDLELPYMTNTDEVETIYDLADQALWTLSGRDAKARAYLSHLGEVISFRITGNDESKRLKIPATWYPDRYVEANIETSLDMWDKKAEIRERMQKIGMLKHKLTYYTFPTGNTIKVKDLLGASMGHDANSLSENSVNGDDSDFYETHLGSEPRSTQRLDISTELKKVLESVDNKLKALDDERERARESLRELSKLYTKPPNETGQPPIHKYSLCGVSTSNYITYIRRRAEPDLIEMDLDADGSAKDADQWWKTEYSPSGSQSVNVVKVGQNEVLLAASKEQKCCIVVYASEKALEEPHLPLPESLEDFVRADNLAFRAELPINHELADTSTEATSQSPRSPPKRKFVEGSEDPSVGDAGQLRWAGMSAAPPYRVDGGAIGTHHELSDFPNGHQPTRNVADPLSRVNHYEQNEVIEKDEHGTGPEMSQLQGVKTVEMQAKSGLPMLIPSMGDDSRREISTSDGMDVDDLPIEDDLDKA